MRPKVILVAFGVLGLLVSGSAYAEDAWIEHTSSGLGLAFEVPSAGCSVREEAFRPDDPAREISHSVIVTCRGPDLLRVDMWVDPGSGNVGAWFEEHLAFLEKGASRVASESRSRLAIPAVVVEHGHSPQTFPRRLVVLKVSGRVYLFSLERAHEVHPAALLDHALGSLRVLDGDVR